MASPHIYQSSELADRRRKEFYNSILQYSPSMPETDHRRLTDSWLTATGATWVWLWLKNPFLQNTPWELREVSCNSSDRSAYIPKDILVPHERPVAEYCIRTETPEYVDDPPNWSRSINGDEYSVACWSALANMGCTSFLTIPFRSPSMPYTPNGSDGPLHDPIEGVICAHFSTAGDYIEHPPDSLILMARLTAITVSNSFQSFQQQILLELNSLAQDYLSFISRKSLGDRKQYVDAVIELIKRRLTVSAVTLFYQQDELVDEVTCLATSGLADSNMRPIPMDKATSTKYRAGEGLTGKVFEDGVPRVLSRLDAEIHVPKTVEQINGTIVGRSDAVLFPIPQSKKSRVRRTVRMHARGVIRCCDHKSNLSPTVNRPFDPFEIKTLGFIARQIAPILDTLNIRVIREETISMIKHDIYNPLGMIRDTVESIEKGIADSDTIVRVKAYDILNIGASALFASNLAQQLDPEPADDRRPDFERTLLEKSIIARNKNMISRYAMRENEMTIRFDGFRDLPVLWVDRDLIERALVNLLTNAIKYGQTRTQIKVLSHVEDDGFHIDVTNDGEGIAKEDEELVFEPRYRGSSPSVRKRLGLGLGLYIARRAVEDHGGALTLTSARNPTTVTIILPEELKRGKPRGVE